MAARDPTGYATLPRLHAWLSAGDVSGAILAAEPLSPARISPGEAMVEIRSYSEILMHLDETPRSHVEGQIIFEEGQSASEMYIVREGVVTLKKADQVIETLGPGAVFGEMALLDQAPRSATAVAGPGCVVAVVDEATFNRLVRAVPGFALELMRLLARRLRKEPSR
jgi:CRP/FNR family cyclic AMP-dependent transcriptional regulator